MMARRALVLLLAASLALSVAADCAGCAGSCKAGKCSNKKCKKGFAFNKAAGDCSDCAVGFGKALSAAAVPLAATAFKAGGGACVKCSASKDDKSPILGMGAAGGNLCQAGSEAIIPAGLFWDFFGGGGLKKCPTGFFALIARLFTFGGARCYTCSNLYAFRGATSAGTIAVAQAASGRRACVCPAGTYFSTDANGGVACVACPLGTTNNAPNQVTKASCEGFLLPGFYGDPATAQYAQGTACAPETTTAGITPAPVDEAAACTKCAVGYVGPDATACTQCQPNAATCDENDPTISLTCKVGYYGADCASECPAALYAVNPASKPVAPTATQIAACLTNGGGCAAGRYQPRRGASCTGVCRIPLAGIFYKGGTFVQPLVAKTSRSNCLFGCAPGTGIIGGSKTCLSCPPGFYSPGATEGNPWPLCLKCPDPSLPQSQANNNYLNTPVVPTLTPAENARCVEGITLKKKKSGPKSLADEFD